jgi:hypothetical protein
MLCVGPLFGQPAYLPETNVIARRQNEDHTGVIAGVQLFKRWLGIWGGLLVEL